MNRISRNMIQFLAGCFCVTFAFISCSLHAPELKVTGERSILEKQVLGSYQRLNQDLWMLNSWRGEEDSLSLHAEQENLLASLRRRNFNRDDRLRLLSAGWLGETNKGKLVAKDESNDISKTEASIRADLVIQENADRAVILGRLKLLNPGNENEIERIFAEIQQEECLKKSWVQNIDGSWRQK
jgi:hypothetical protein